MLGMSHFVAFTFWLLPLRGNDLLSRAVYTALSFGASKARRRETDQHSSRRHREQIGRGNRLGNFTRSYTCVTGVESRAY